MYYARCKMHYVLVCSAWRLYCPKYSNPSDDGTIWHSLHKKIHLLWVCHRQLMSMHMHGGSHACVFQVRE